VARLRRRFGGGSWLGGLSSRVAGLRGGRNPRRESALLASRVARTSAIAFTGILLACGDGGPSVPEWWIDSSFTVCAYSPFNGHGYGWGWWGRNAGEYLAHFAWGYGGQFIFIVPALRATVVMTSDAEARREWGHVDALHELLDVYVIPGLEKQGRRRH
jgi:CubicO group peptidase (beta-lactamase class C family)